MSITGPNIGRVQVDFAKIAAGKLKDMRVAVSEFANEVVQDAKVLAPINESRLRNSISAKKISDFQYEIVAQTKYAAYIEFGTRTKVVIPPGAEEIAKQAQLQPKSGTIADMEKNIRRWVEKKGIAGLYSVKTRKLSKSKASKDLVESAVFLIMRHILKVGINPQPYFFPAIQNNTPKLDKRLKEIIKQ